MPVKIHIPAMLRHESGGAFDLSVPAKTIRGALDQLERSHASLYRCVCNETGALRPHMHLFINSDLVMDDELDTRLKPNDELFIMPAVSGG